MRVFLFLGLVCALAVTSGAGDRSPVESNIVALEKAWNQAYKFRDKTALSHILHDSLVLVNDDGSLQTKGSFLASIDLSKPVDEQQAEPESISVSVIGDVAIATGVFREKGVEKGKAYVRRNRFVDTWVKTNGIWVCVAASATPMLH